MTDRKLSLQGRGWFGKKAVDMLTLNASGQLRAFVQGAGDELRTSADHAVRELDRTIERRIGALESQTLQLVEATFKRSVAESTAAARIQVEAAVNGVGRRLMGLAIPLAVAAFALFTHSSGAPRALSAGRTIGLSVALAAASTSLMIIADVARPPGGDPRPTNERLRSALVEFVPLGAFGVLLAVAFVLAR